MASSDAAGGGGGGGSIILNVGSYTNAVNANATGGAGGDSKNGRTTALYYLGSGGGGGGGVVAVNAGAVDANLTTNVAGGANGTSFDCDNNIANCAITPSTTNATSGTAGGTLTSFSIPAGSTPCAVTAPVEVFRLLGDMTTDGNELQWALKGTDAYRIFTVERQNKAGWQALATTAYTGQHLYKYTDAQPDVQNKYRIRVQDYTGNSYYSNTLIMGTGVSQQVLDFTLFPNPVRSNASLAIETQGLGKVHSILLYSVSGQLIHSMKPEGSHLVTIDLKQLPVAAGTYVVKVKTQAQDLHKKLIITP